MNTQKTSPLKTFLQHLGRGAAMFDGGFSTEAQHAPGADSAEKNDAYWAEVASKTALCQPRRFSMPGRG